MTMTSKDIDMILLDMDPGAKDSFVSMPREQQLLIIFGMGMSNSNRLAVVERRQIEFEKDARAYRIHRESRENDHSNDVMTTTDKIAEGIKKAFAQRFDAGVYFRDKILPTIISTILLALIAIIGLFMAGKLP